MNSTDRKLILLISSWMSVIFLALSPATAQGQKLPMSELVEIAIEISEISRKVTDVRNSQPVASDDFAYANSLLIDTLVSSERLHRCFDSYLFYTQGNNEYRSSKNVKQLVDSTRRQCLDAVDFYVSRASIRDKGLAVNQVIKILENQFASALKRASRCLASWNM